MCAFDQHQMETWNPVAFAGQCLCNFSFWQAKQGICIPELTSKSLAAQEHPLVTRGVPSGGLFVPLVPRDSFRILCLTWRCQFTKLLIGIESIFCHDLQAVLVAVAHVVLSCRGRHWRRAGRAADPGPPGDGGVRVVQRAAALPGPRLRARRNGERRRSLLRSNLGENSTLEAGNWEKNQADETGLINRHSQWRNCCFTRRGRIAVYRNFGSCQKAKCGSFLGEILLLWLQVSRRVLIHRISTVLQADASEKMRQMGISHMFPHPVRITQTRSCPLEPPPPPEVTPAWKLIRPRIKKTTPCSDEPTGAKTLEISGEFPGCHSV